MATSTSLTGDVAEIAKVILIAIFGVAAILLLKGFFDSLKPSSPDKPDEGGSTSPLFFGPFKSPSLNAANVLAGPENQFAELDDLISRIQKFFSGGDSGTVQQPNNTSPPGALAQGTEVGSYEQGGDISSTGWPSTYPDATYYGDQYPAY